MSLKQTKQFDHSASSFRPPTDAAARAWIKILERIGPENVRSKLGGLESRIGAGAAIPLGEETYFTVGFAQEWLAWTDQQRALVEQRRNDAMKWATIWAAIAAGLSALGAIAQAVIAVVAYLKPPHT
ncbi:hypothetical protein [Bradyrhizobium sp. McL0616]|uniref:hypothetical protein n=1 Tax=Bradyrhizobium sp. McL0616 TaxID=3415674 RepID=UPI003CEA2F67